MSLVPPAGRGRSPRSARTATTGAPALRLLRLLGGVPEARARAEALIGEAIGYHRELGSIQARRGMALVLELLQQRTQSGDFVRMFRGEVVPLPGAPPALGTIAPDTIN